MHELSIADALLEQVKPHVPAGAKLCAVHVRIGPFRAIEPEALRFAWQAMVENTALAGSELKLDLLPWTLRCPACQREWTAARLDEICTCGHDGATPSGSNEIILTSLVVDEPEG